MGKKSTRSDRRAAAAAARSRQRARERRRGRAIVSACLAVAVLIVGAAAYRPARDWYDLHKIQGIGLTSVGASAGVCGKVITKPAEGDKDAVPNGSQVTYSDAPPAFGAHWADTDPVTDGADAEFYTVKDRPELEQLVEKLHQGYTVMWYDSSLATDPSVVNTIDGITAKFRADPSNDRNRFIAAPWTAADERESGTFPRGMHVAFTHWSAGGAGQTDSSRQVGAFEYCSQVSGSALKNFMLKYPYFDSPAPGGT